MRTSRLLTLLAAAAIAAPLAGCGGDDAAAPGAAATEAATAARGAETTPGEGAASAPGAAAERRGVRLTRIGSFDQPVQAFQAPGDRSRLFVVEQGGAIRVVRDGRTLPEPFLDLSGEVTSGGEQGLLSMAFAPDYARSGRLYVDYTDTEGDTRVVEYRRGAGADAADPASARLVLTQDQPEPNHNGGLLLFGPDDLLYVGFGDGGGANDQHGERGNGQDLGTWLGKLLRIDPRASGGRPYRVPDDNPFVGRAGARPEIWAFGLRNPWRFSFDRATGDLTIGDVGQDEVEEIDFAPRARGGGAGANFGWRAWEGTRRVDPGTPAPGHVPPVLEYEHAGTACSVTGGVVVRDPRLPELRGRYLYADFCVGDLQSARLRDDGATDRAEVGLHVDAPTSFGEDLAGRVHVVSQAGPVYRLDPR